VAAADVLEVSGRAPERSMSQNLQMWKSTGERPHGHRPRTTFPQLWRLLWKGRICLLRPRFSRIEPHVFKR
jgi:hypothetical protein